MAKFKLDGTDVEIEVRDEDVAGYLCAGWVLVEGDMPESDEKTAPKVERLAPESAPAPTKTKKSD